MYEVEWPERSDLEIVLRLLCLVGFVHSQGEGRLLRESDSVDLGSQVGEVLCGRGETERVRNYSVREDKAKTPKLAEHCPNRLQVLRLDRLWVLRNLSLHKGSGQVRLQIWGPLDIRPICQVRQLSRREALLHRLLQDAGFARKTPGGEPSDHAR